MLSIARNTLKNTFSLSCNVRLLTSSSSLWYGSQKYPETIDRNHIEKLINNNKVVIFMKGVPDSPKCGFSNAVVQVLRMHGIKYDSHDVLENDGIRQGIKDFTEWPTIPQVFIDGEFIGGCDIMLQKHQNGELVEELKKVGIVSALVDEPSEEETPDDTKKSK